MATPRGWNKKSILLALHVCVAAITSVLLWVYPPTGGPSAWIVVPWLLYLVATGTVGLLPEYWFAHRRFDLAFVAVEAMLLGPILAAYFRAETWMFYPLLLLAVLLAALARRLVWALGMGTAVAAVHAFFALEQLATDPGVLILQTVLVVTITGVVGYLTEELAEEEATTTMLDNALEISTLLAGALEAERVHERLTELIARLFRAGRVAVILTEPDSDTARVAAAVDKGEQITDLAIDLERYPEIQSALERHAPVIITRPDQHAGMEKVRGELPGRARHSSILVSPIMQNEEPRGVIFVRLEGARRGFTDHEIKFCRLMADTAGQALDRAERYAEVAEAARRDSLTGLYNVRVFHRRLADEVERAGRTDGELSLVMIDVDYLKHVNDTYGHLAGDQVIQRMAVVLMREVRSIDTVARYGGEEFAMLLPDTDGDRGLVVAERIRARIENTGYDGVPEPVTVSIGIATLPDDATTPTELIHKADQALYVSKNGGRNRATRYGEREFRIEAGSRARADEEAVSIAVGDQPLIDDLRETLESLETGRGGGRHVDVVTSLTSVMRAKDPAFFEQLRSVSTVAELFLTNLPVAERQRWAIHVACLLRDIGKLVISDDLLQKKGFLTREEYRLVRQHPEIGARIIEPLQGFEAVIPYVRYHHERWDGKGYPDQLTGEEIPYGARVVGIIDSFQAMVRRRPYADRARGLRYACEEIRRNAGTQFDPGLSERFLHVVDENRDIIATLVSEREGREPPQGERTDESAIAGSGEEETPPYPGPSGGRIADRAGSASD